MLYNQIRLALLLLYVFVQGYSQEITSSCVTNDTLTEEVVSQ